VDSYYIIIIIIIIIIQHNVKHVLTIYLQIYGLEYPSSGIQTAFPRWLPGFPQAHFLYNEMGKYEFDNINF